MNRLDKKQIFLLIIFFIILLPQYPSFFKSSFNKALAQSSNYTKFTTPYGGFIFKYSLPNIVSSGSYLYSDDYNYTRRVDYTLTLIPYELDRNNNFSLYLNFEIIDSVLNPPPGLSPSYAYRRFYFALGPRYLGKLKQEYLNNKYILIYIDLNTLYDLALRDGKYSSSWYAYEILYSWTWGAEKLSFCDKDIRIRDCEYLKTTGYATNTPLKRAYYDHYMDSQGYIRADWYFSFPV